MRNRSFLNIVIAEWLDPLLARFHFERRGKTWNRRVDPFIHVMDAQRAKSSTPGSEHFTINIGAFSPHVFQVVWQKPSPSFVKETNCAVRLRIGDLVEGSLSGKATDIWWEIDNPDEISEVGRRVASIVELKAIPFLNQIRSRESMIGIMTKIGGWQRKYPLHLIYLAVLNADVGKPDIAAELLEEAGKNPAWQSRALMVKRHYELA